uniref:Reverse transcriptase domain-containing protein n=1 Tax=Nicotiana tabacum TaxID=4097 RepID=A0A1S3X335_TOBAC|nr:PREDICTED: uncharacterized protein LOC107760556 [Nicotiana tabacum]
MENEEVENINPRGVPPLVQIEDQFDEVAPRPANRILRDYARSDHFNCESGVRKPPMPANNFEIRTDLIQMIQQSCTTQDDDSTIRIEAEILDKDSEEEEMKSEEVQSKIELKTLPSHLKYVYLEEELFPIIISPSLIAEQGNSLIIVLKAHKGALGWTIKDIKGISPAICTHRVLMEDSYKPIVQPQRRLNPAMQEVMKKEVVKLLAAGIIYPISDSPWVSPIQVVPKKGGMTVIKNKNNELIPTKVVTGWRVCIDYGRLNDATRKDHFPLTFIDQVLERIAGYDFYCFLDGYSGYNQIPIAPEDQDKTTFICPHGTYAYRRMPFGLCNAPATFQRCMSAIFADMTDKFLEIFMDDFTLFCKTYKDFDCVKAFETLKKKFSTAPVVVSPDWNQPFEVMCDSSDTTVGVVLGQRKDKTFRPIYYASRTLNNIIRKCVPKEEMNKILYHCHDRAIGGHYGANRTTFKVLEAVFFWPTLFKDARAYVAQCDRCHRICNITKRDEMPLQSIQVTVQPEHLTKASIKTESPVQE